MHTAYAPDLPGDTLWLERAILIGVSVSQITYGILVVIFLQAFTYLVSPKQRHGGRLQKALITYTCVMFGLGTIFISTDMRALQRMFIDNRDFPGGPTAFHLLTQYSKPNNILSNTSAVMSSLLADGFLLYRCLVIFHLSPYVVALPILMYMGTLSMSIMFLFQTSRPGAGLFENTTLDFGVPYFALSTSLNVIISAMISIRLLVFRRSVMQAIGRNEAVGAIYVSTVAMIVESAMLYSVTSMLFVVPYGLRSHVANIFLPILAQVQIIAPLLIILRVASRKAWDARTTGAVLTTLACKSDATRPMPTISSSGGKEHGGNLAQLWHAESGVSAVNASTVSQGASTMV